MQSLLSAGRRDIPDINMRMSKHSAVPPHLSQMAPAETCYYYKITFKILISALKGQTCLLTNKKQPLCIPSLSYPFFML